MLCPSRLLLLAVGTFLAALPAATHAVPLTAELEIATGVQGFGAGFSRAEIATSPDDSYLVVFRDAVSLGSNAVFVQRLDSDAVPANGPTQVNATSALSVREPALDFDSTGDAIVVWSRNGDIYARRLDDADSPVGGEFLVSGAVAQEVQPRIAVDRSGDYMVVWRQLGASDSILARRFDATDSPLGASFQVNTTSATNGLLWNSRISMAADGAAVVVWEQFEFSSSFFVRGQRYASGGAAAGSEFVVTTGANEGQPEIGHAGAGEFVVAWRGDRLAGAPNLCCHINAQRYDAAGVAVGVAFQLSDGSADIDSHSLAVHQSGNFVSAWGNSDANEAWWIYVRAFDSTGTPTEPALELPGDASTPQEFPSLAGGTSERIVLVWQKDSQTLVRRRSPNVNLPSFGSMGLIVLAVLTAITGVRRLRPQWCAARTW